MKRLFVTILTLTTISLQAFSCKCAFTSIKEDILESDLVFSGTVTKKEIVNGSYAFTFATVKTWKGNENNVNVILTNESTIACGADFELGKEYIIFSSAGQTSKCRRNTLTADSYFIGILNFILVPSFKNSVGLDTNAILNSTESEYFNSIFNPIIKDTFDFTDKKVAFVENTTLTNKKRYFERWGDHETVSQLVLLSGEEKKESAGYDAIIISWRKTGVSKRYKRQLIKRLGTKTHNRSVSLP